MTSSAQIRAVLRMSRRGSEPIRATAPSPERPFRPPVAPSPTTARRPYQHGGVLTIANANVLTDDALGAPTPLIVGAPDQNDRNYTDGTIYIPEAQSFSARSRSAREASSGPAKTARSAPVPPTFSCGRASSGSTRRAGTSAGRSGPSTRHAISTSRRQPARSGRARSTEADSTPRRSTTSSSTRTAPCRCSPSEPISPTSRSTILCSRTLPTRSISMSAWTTAFRREQAA